MTTVNRRPNKMTVINKTKATRNKAAMTKVVSPTVVAMVVAAAAKVVSRLCIR